MSSDMALRFSGLLKVMTPTPSATLCRILPSAKDLSVLLRTSSIGAAFGGWTLMHRIEALVRCLGNGSTLPLPLCSRGRANLPALAGEPTAHLHSFDARRQSLPTVLREVEGEEPFEIFGPLQHLGVPQGASRIVVSRAPMLLHACSREFIIIGMRLIIPGSVYQV